MWGRAGTNESESRIKLPRSRIRSRWSFHDSLNSQPTTLFKFLHSDFILLPYWGAPHTAPPSGARTCSPQRVQGGTSIEPFRARWVRVTCCGLQTRAPGRGRSGRSGCVCVRVHSCSLSILNQQLFSNFCILPASFRLVQGGPHMQRPAVEIRDADGCHQGEAQRASTPSHLTNREVTIPRNHTLAIGQAIGVRDASSLQLRNN